jgi:hypothetical protein
MTQMMDGKYDEPEPEKKTEPEMGTSTWTIYAVDLNRAGIALGIGGG